MKKIYFSFLLIIIFAFFAHTKYVLADVSYVEPVEKVLQFGSKITVGKDAKLSVEEKITYNFGTHNKHGIFRYIPVKYVDRSNTINTNYNLRLHVLSVKDESGIDYKYTVKNKADRIYVQIGDADKTVTGIKTYIISYEVERAVSFLPDHDEIYWNVVGPGWEVPIVESSVAVLLPNSIQEKDLNVTCFNGVVGSTEGACAVEKIGSNVVIKNSTSLPAYNDFTVVVGFPKGNISSPTSAQKIMWFIQDNWILFTPFVVFAIMFYLWYTRGKELKGRGVVVAEYEPPDNLLPIEVSTIVRQKISIKHISSIFIHLAVKGYLKIIYLGDSKKDYALKKLKDGSSITNPVELLVFNELFSKKDEVTLADLKNSFYKTAPKVIGEVYKKITNDGYFLSNPAKLRTRYYILAILIGLSGFVLATFSLIISSTMNIFVPMISGFIIGFFGYFMPRYTQKGIMAKEKIEGFKLFLSVTEKDRLAFHNAPAKKPELFEKFLPYAMVLGVEKEWSKQFEGIYVEPPSWYVGNWQAFTLMNFTRDLSTFSSKSNSVFISNPSSGSGFSGGSSGGGFGGGGGGSW